MTVWHLKQIKKVKKLRKWVPSWADWKSKNLSLSSVIFSYSAQQTISYGLWCATKSGLYMTTSDNQLSGWTEKQLQSTFQSQTCTKKGHGHCLVVCCWSDPLQLFESWWNHYIWGVCSANWWDALKTAMPVAGTGQQKGPNSSPQGPTACLTTSASKVEWIGLRSFASSTIFIWPLSN